MKRSVLWLVGLAACSGPVLPDEPMHDAAAATTTWSEAALDDAPVLPMSVVWRTGGASATSGHTFARASHGALDARGRAHIVDSDGVSVLGTDGDFAFGYGPPGDGPAELTNPRGIDIVGDTVFVLADALKLFTADGALIGQLSPRTAEYARAHYMRWTDTGIALQHRRTMRGESGADTVDVRFVRRADTTLLPARVPVGRRFDLVGNRGASVPPLMASNPAVAVDRRGRVYSSDAAHMMVEVRDSVGRRLELLVGDVARQPTTRTDLDDVIATHMRFLNGGGVSIGDFSRTPRVRFRPAIRHMFVAPDGALLLERPDLTDRPYRAPTGDASAVWHVVGADRTITGRIDLPLGHRPLAWEGCTLLTRGLDDDDVPVLTLFRMPCAADLPRPR